MISFDFVTSFYKAITKVCYNIKGRKSYKLLIDVKIHKYSFKVKKCYYIMTFPLNIITQYHKGNSTYVSNTKQRN